MAAAQEPIRVGAWNIEHLGSPGDRDYPNHRADYGWNVAQRSEDIAAQILALDLDVLALEEIDDTQQGDGKRTNQILDQAFASLNQTPGNNWEYLLFAKRRREAESQYSGLAWNNARVQAQGRPLRIAVSDVTTDRYAEWDRHPHAMKFSRGAGRTDFIVVPIHMKAGGSEDQPQREAEARSLIAELDEISEHFDDQDIILIGDFNMRGRNEEAGVAFRNHGLFDLNYYVRATHYETDWPLDRCYVPRSQRANGKEFEAVREVRIAAPEGPEARRNFRRELSDHWPIVLAFPELADDD